MKNQKVIEFSTNNSSDDISNLEVALLRPDKTFRDAIHGDIMLTQLEVRIIDTIAFQRLRGIKQLGTTNLVYDCANHTRFEHALGCLYMANKLINLINSNPFNNHQISNYDRFLIRLCALLHDLAHIPYGHTIEDEAGFFKDSEGNSLGQWKDPERFNLFLGAKSEIVEIIKNYKLLNDLWKRGFDEYNPSIVIKELQQYIYAIESHVLTKLNKPYIADIIGNTLCADLLDYIIRDIYFTGLHENYDERFLSYLYIDSNKEDKKLRLILRLHKPTTKRLRRDVLSELLHLLRLRYSLAEKVYYHHAKISSSAMIISAITSLFVENRIKKENLYWMSDDELVRFMHNENTGTKVSQYLMKKLLSHGLYKPVYGLKFEGDEDSKKAKKDVIRKQLMNHDYRYKFERELEIIHDLAPGSIAVYCPQEGMGAKAVEALVNIDGYNIGILKDIAPNRVKEEINYSIIRKHKELWGMYIFIDKELSVDNNRMSLICGDCEKHFDVQNELEECESFRDSKHPYYLQRHEDRFSDENKDVKRLKYDEILQKSFREYTDSIFISYNEWCKIRKG